MTTKPIYNFRIPPFIRGRGYYMNSKIYTILIFLILCSSLAVADNLDVINIEVEVDGDEEQGSKRIRGSGGAFPGPGRAKKSAAPMG